MVPVGSSPQCSWHIKNTLEQLSGDSTIACTPVDLELYVKLNNSQFVTLSIYVENNFYSILVSTVSRCQTEACRNVILLRHGHHNAQCPEEDIYSTIKCLHGHTVVSRRHGPSGIQYYWQSE